MLVTNAVGVAESDLALAPTVGTLIAATVLCSTALFAATVAAGALVTRLR